MSDLERDVKNCIKLKNDFNVRFTKEEITLEVICNTFVYDLNGKYMKEED